MIKTMTCKDCKYRTGQYSKFNNQCKLIEHKGMRFALTDSCPEWRSRE